MSACQGCRGPLPTEHGNRKWCSERCRKRSYDLVCVDCGGRVSGTDPGTMRNPDEPVCRGCAAEHYATWTREAIVSAIQRWASEHGHVPSVPEFQTAQATGEPIPTVTHVQHRFGSWNAALTAAGLPINGRGPRSGLYRCITDEQRQECVRRYAAGESSVVIAADIGCSPSWVLQLAHRAGVPARPAFGRAA